MQTVACDKTGLERAADVLNAGGVAVIPTDTVYGLAASPRFPDAVRRLYGLKGRDSGKPIALLASDVEAIARFGFPLSGEAAALAEAHWPGALTLVVQNAAGETEGFRIPAHAWTRALIARCGGLLRVTSANASGQAAATTYAAACREIGLLCDLLVDDGASPGGEASTVVKVGKTGELQVLRHGAIDLPPRA